MTRIQLVIVMAIAAIIAIIAAPRAIKMSRISRAERDILAIATGFAKYRMDTGQECTRIADILEDPGVTGWSGPYIDRKVIRNPWGGTYEVGLEHKEIGIAKGDPAPDRYEFDGAEEISFDFSEGTNLL